MALVFNGMDGEVLGKTMYNAAAQSLMKGGKVACEFAQHEFTQYSEDLNQLQKMVSDGTLTAEQGQYYADRRKLAMNSTLLTIDGLGLIDVQNAVNAALAVLTSALGNALMLKV
ncbi:MAG TPA: hypothetical protein VKC60_15970 [Opitutaceae bacterium]|nr:hypothetical protein [Opitutaceae bacterium]